MKTLSIIIISYNEIKYLEHAIDSCLNQEKNFDFEIIIGDDGSSDGSIEVIDTYAEQYPEIIHYFIMDRDIKEDIIQPLRVSNILRRAFSIAEGQFLFILSADDIIIGKNRLQMQVDFLYENVKYIACYTDYMKFWPDGTEKKIITRKSLKRDTFWAVHYVHISCFVFRREVLLNLLPRICDDTGLLFSILKTGKAAHISEIGFGYRQHDNSAMREADYLEFCLIELLIFQDVLNMPNGKISKLISLSRYAELLKYTYRNKYMLKQDKYKKYLNFSKKNDNDIINLINFENNNKNIIRKIRIFFLIAFSQLLRFSYKIRRRLELL